LQALDPLLQGGEGAVEVGPGEAHERNLQGHPRVDRVPQVHLGLPEHLHGPDQRGRAESPGLLGEALVVRSGEQHEVRGHQREESLV
jgi:hypothetical protein